jgi:hypothetical protein
MPVIARAAAKPLPPEGPAKLFIDEITIGKSKEKKTPFFGLGLRDLGSKLTLKDRVYLTPTSAWKVDALCKSAQLILPDGPYRLTTDDLENRVVFGVIAYEAMQDGRQVAKMKTFWRKEYALEQAPDLALIPDPPGVPGPVKLPLVETPAETEATAAPAPVTATAATPPPVQASPVNTETEADASEDSEGVSDEELAEAFAYAKALKAKKATAGVGK